MKQCQVFPTIHYSSYSQKQCKLRSLILTPTKAARNEVVSLLPLPGVQRIVTAVVTQVPTVDLQNHDTTHPVGYALDFIGPGNVINPYPTNSSMNCKANLLMKATLCFLHSVCLHLSPSFRNRTTTDHQGGLQVGTPANPPWASDGNQVKPRFGEGHCSSTGSGRKTYLVSQ